MKTAKAVKNQILRYKKGQPFSIRRLHGLGSRKAVESALARLVKEGVVYRVCRGIYARPQYSRFSERPVPPSVGEVVKEMVKYTGERIAITGGQAVLDLRLSTQVPMMPVYYTSGRSRELAVGKRRVRFLHVANRKLQLSGTLAGHILSALWFLGKHYVNEKVLAQIGEVLPPEVLREELAKVQAANIPEWMSRVITNYQMGVAT